MHQRGDRELDRRREALEPNSSSTGLAGDRGGAEVPAEHAAEELDVLDGDRLVEAEHPVEVGDPLGGGAVAEERGRRSPGRLRSQTKSRIDSTSSVGIICSSRRTMNRSTVAPPLDCLRRRPRVAPPPAAVPPEYPRVAPGQSDGDREEPLVGQRAGSAPARSPPPPAPAASCEIGTAGRYFSMMSPVDLLVRATRALRRVAVGVGVGDLLVHRRVVLRRTPASAGRRTCR